MRGGRLPRGVARRGYGFAAGCACRSPPRGGRLRRRAACAARSLSMRADRRTRLTRCGRSRAPRPGWMTYSRAARRVRRCAMHARPAPSAVSKGFCRPPARRPQFPCSSLALCNVKGDDAVTRFATPLEVVVPPSSPQVDNLYLVVLDPRRLIRWMYIGRLSIASSIFIAASFNWFQAEASRTFVATWTLVGAIFFTAASFLWTEVNRKSLTKGFLYGQLIFDLLVVTAVVHVTRSANTGAQFAALYILVNAAAALMLPIGGALLIAALGLVIYAFDAIIVSGFSNATSLQLSVFSVVALSTVYISARLQQAGQGREQLVAELTRVRLREKDILPNIKSGIMTVDDTGT